MFEGLVILSPQAFKLGLIPNDDNGDFLILTYKFQMIQN